MYELSYPDSRDMFEEEWNKLNGKNIVTIHQFVDGGVFHNVSKKTMAQSLWKKLHDLYKRMTAANKVLLITQLVNLKSKQGIAHYATCKFEIE